MNNSTSSTRFNGVNKVTNLEDIKAFIDAVGGDEVTFSLQPNLDGLAVEALYVGGVLQSVLTRGDGVYGDNITEVVKQLKLLPTEVNFETSSDSRVRGDIIINSPPKHLITKLLKGGVEVNPPDLEFIAYDYLGDTRGIASHESLLSMLDSLGFSVIYSIPCVGSDLIESVSTGGVTLHPSNKIAKGIIIKVNQLQMCRRLGSDNGKYNWCVVYMSE